MPNYTQATLAAVLPAGLARVAQLALDLVNEEAKPVPSQAHIALRERQIIDLRGGLELVATSADPLERDKMLAYLQNTYGLLAADIDPLLRSSYPVVPVSGAVVQQFVLGTGLPGRVLGTGVAGHTLATRAILQPVDAGLTPGDDVVTA